MEGQSSSTTFHSVPTVAEKAGIPRQTLYKWIKTERVKHTHDVDGRPVFTNEECQAVVKFTAERKELLKRASDHTM